MEKRNVWTNVKEPLELHEDSRGKIADIFYKEEINHVAIIKTKIGEERALPLSEGAVMKHGAPGSISNR